MGYRRVNVGHHRRQGRSHRMREYLRMRLYGVQLHSMRLHRMYDFFLTRLRHVLQLQRTELNRMRHYQMRSHYRKFQLGHYHRRVQKHLYPVVFKSGNYYATKNGFGYRRVVFSNGRFLWRSNDGIRFVIPVRHFQGYPVVYSYGYYWGTDNGRDYFVVHYSNSHYHRAQHMHLLMRLHLSHGTVYRSAYTFRVMGPLSI